MMVVVVVVAADGYREASGRDDRSVRLESTPQCKRTATYHDSLVPNNSEITASFNHSSPPPPSLSLSRGHSKVRMQGSYAFALQRAVSASKRPLSLSLSHPLPPSTPRPLPCLSILPATPARAIRVLPDDQRSQKCSAWVSLVGVAVTETTDGAGNVWETNCDRCYHPHVSPKV